MAPGGGVVTGGAASTQSTGGGAAPGGAAGSTGAAVGQRSMARFARVAFRDPAAGNVEAIVVLVPDGWQAAGAVQWLPDWSRLAFLQTRIADPATGLAIEWLPIQDFIWFQAPAGFQAPIGGNYQGKAYVPPITDPLQFVAQHWMPGVLAHLQSAQVVSVVQVPAIADEFKRGFGGPAQAFAYRIRYAYVSGGQAWEEDVSFALLYSESPSITSWYVNFAYAVRAPAGQIDRSGGVISTAVASRTSTPEWEASFRLVQQLFRQGLQQQMADTAAFGRMLTQYRAESAALQAQVTQERQASQDRIADLQREVLGGVQTYVDPVNRTLVQLPVGWNEYWVNQRGEYLASDQPGFNPNTLNDGSWLRLATRPG